jgi:hypothetical protein
LHIAASDDGSTREWLHRLRKIFLPDPEEAFGFSPVEDRIATTQELQPLGKPQNLIRRFFEDHGGVVGAVAVQESGGAGEDAEGGEDEDSDHGGETFLSVGFRLRFQGVSTTFPALKCNFRMPHPPKVRKQNFGVTDTTIVQVIL